MDFFKMAEFFFKFIMGQRQVFSERTQEISVEILNQIRRILILVVITIGALTMFCMGMSHLIERVLDNFDQGAIFFSPSIGVILVFLLCCLLILVYSTNKNVWLNLFKKEKIEKEEVPQNPLGSQIESVISLLILDFIRERENKRESREEGGLNE